ncbi:MAG: hypothetical protein IIV87_05235 [Oscillospiraceae bacterium]|nr:hypothetical protein [Oscillospiraceae bacterium]
MGSTMLLMDLVAVACGVYCLYTWLRLIITKKLFKNGLLVPKEKDVSDCEDEELYISYILPHLTILAVVTTLYSIYIIAETIMDVILLPGFYSLIPLGLVMAALIWFAVKSGRANQDFFGL